MAEKQGQLNEQKVAAASFVINFYSEILQLKSYYASYVNLITQFKAKYKGDVNNISDAEDNTLLLSNANNVKYFVTMSFIDYKALFTFLSAEDKNLKGNPDIKTFADIMQTKIIPDCEDVEKYVDAINKFLISTIIKKLLETSQDIVDRVYA